MRRIFLTLAALALGFAPGCADTRRSADSGRPPPMADGGACGGLTMCPLGCADLVNDPSNCGTCGNTCDAGLFCVSGTCGTCTPTCGDVECGSDGCGGSCGTCGDSDCIGGFCEDTCTPACGDVECGSDGCGGSCGTCGDSDCIGGFCEGTCEPDCFDVECGTDGCGGSCGTCETGSFCVVDGGYCDMATSAGGESCSDAIVVGVSDPRSFSLSGYAADHTPFGCGSDSGASDVVFAFTAPRSGFATFQTTGSSDLVMALFGSIACGSSETLECDDDDGDGANPLIEANVFAGETYYAAVAPYSSGSTGSGTFTVTMD